MSDDKKDDSNDATKAAEDAVKAAAEAAKAATEKADKSETKEAKETADNKKTGDSFSSEYVKELRDEAKQHRLKAKEAEDKLADAQKKLEDVGKQSVDKVNKLHGTFEKRVINSEMRALAAQEGLQEKFFKMLDLSAVKMNDDGEIIGLKESMDGLRKNCPEIFKVKSTSEKGAFAPDEEGSAKERPTYETPKEFQDKKREFLKSLR